MVDNFPNLGKEIDIHVEEAQRVNRMKRRSTTLRYIIIKMAKDKDKQRILKAEKEKQ